ncbi:hypothetical protein EB796_007395 [Bugula neritina]|uniref:Uncharacterized protein n=1 Tax=Bugula neritina TaxID=10212 RepID=A0A7J7K6P9_BUGNE|nr:hypothetical protein EB796_007395 [Bugula neritina]
MCGVFTVILGVLTVILGVLTVVIKFFLISFTGIQTSTPSSSTINIQNVTGLQTVQGLPNVQVSLTSLGQGGIAVPVSLIGGYLETSLSF